MENKTNYTGREIIVTNLKFTLLNPLNVSIRVSQRAYANWKSILVIRKLH